MNLPNRLTVGRLGLTVAFVGVLSAGSALPYRNTIALMIFIAAAVTDYVDGEIARRYGLVTDFGKLMDPLADKVMTAAAFVFLVPLGAVPAWVAVLIISREFLITGLRQLALVKGRVLPAERMGKHKTSWQIATVIFFFGLLAVCEWLGANPPRPATDVGTWTNTLWRYGGWVVSGVAVVLTIYSGIGYAWKHRAVIETE